MSYSSDLKYELISNISQDKDSLKAELSAVIKLNGSLRLKGGGDYFLEIAHYDPSFVRYLKKIFLSFGVKTSTNMQNLTTPRKRRLYYLVIDDVEKSKNAMEEFFGKTEDFFENEIPKYIFTKKKYKIGYLRGAFLSSGSISDPHRSHHLYVKFTSLDLAKDFKRLVKNVLGIDGSISENNEKYLVYFKKAECINDILSAMGSIDTSLEYQNIIAEKDLKVRVNRIQNCDNANIDRSVDAAKRQLRNIEIISEKMGLENLDSKLYEIALIRVDYPDISLEEIGKIVVPPIKKSGVNGRFKKIEKIAESLL